MSWDPIRDLEPTRLYEDEHGNIRRRSTETGQFVSGVHAPSYGRWGYGRTVDLQAVPAADE